jgi:hypothetical protein
MPLLAGSPTVDVAVVDPAGGGQPVRAVRGSGDAVSGCGTRDTEAGGVVR